VNVVEYACGFYRNVTPFDEVVMKKTLKALEDFEHGFFPATLWTAKDSKVILKSAEQYDRSLIPAGYHMSHGLATLPLDAANGASFVFTETDDPQTLPASLVLSFTDATVAANGWGLETLVSLFRVVIASFQPDYAHLYDEAHGTRPSYTERMFDFDGRRVPAALYWINYYGPQWAKNLGTDRLERLRPLVPSLEWLDNGGVIVAIQDAPYDESVAEHRDHHLELERLLGLEEIQASFPNLGV
jgi:hypothetical protein